MTESIRTHRAVSRRTVVAGLAWSVPAIAATAAAPAFAASPEACDPVTVWVDWLVANIPGVVSDGAAGTLSLEPTSPRSVEGVRVGEGIDFVDSSGGPVAYLMPGNPMSAAGLVGVSSMTYTRVEVDANDQEIASTKIEWFAYLHQESCSIVWGTVPSTCDPDAVAAQWSDVVARVVSIQQDTDPSYRLSFDAAALTWSLSFTSGSADVGEEYISDYVVLVEYADGTTLAFDIAQDPDATTCADALSGQFLAPGTSYAQTRQAPAGLDQVVSLTSMSFTNVFEDPSGSDLYARNYPVGYSYAFLDRETCQVSGGEGGGTGS